MLKDTQISEVIARKQEMTKELIMKMLDDLKDYSDSKQSRIIMDRKEIFDNLPIIDFLQKNDMINGRTNTEVYNFYLTGCIDFGIEQHIKKENLAKYLCKYFGFSIASKRDGEKMLRVYKKEPEQKDLKEYHYIDFDKWEHSSVEKKIKFCKMCAAWEANLLTSDDYRLMLQFLLGIVQDGDQDDM